MVESTAIENPIFSFKTPCQKSLLIQIEHYTKNEVFQDFLRKCDQTEVFCGFGHIYWRNPHFFCAVEYGVQTGPITWDGVLPVL